MFKNINSEQSEYCDLNNRINDVSYVNCVLIDYVQKPPILCVVQGFNDKRLTYFLFFFLILLAFGMSYSF